MEAPQLSTIPVEAGTSVPPGISAPELPSPSERHVVAPGEHSSSPVVIKRRPGRPKGSGKKQQQTNPPVVEGEKIKRPVGRPRKDGLPAGSVGPRRAARPRKSSLKVSPSAVQLPPGVPFPGAYYPQHPGVLQWQTGLQIGGAAPPSISAPPATTLSAGTMIAQACSIDPSLNRDEWAELMRTKPDKFMHELLTALAAPNPLPSAGPTVEDTFKSHLTSLSLSASQNKEAHALPSLYSTLKSFWLPSSPAYLSLIASGPNARTPSEHRFLYWDPLPLVFNGIGCSSCNTPLSNRGRIRSGPIKVYDLEKPFFIIGCEYACRSSTCTTNATPDGRKFASTDASIMRALPARLKEEFPARLLQSDADLGGGANVWNWHAMGVSKSLWNMVKGCLRVGMSKDATIHVICAIQNPLKEDRERHEMQEVQEVQEVQGADATSEDAQGIPVVVQPEDGDAMIISQNNEYHGAWKGNDSTAEAGPSPASAAPSHQTPISALPNMTPDMSAAPQPHIASYAPLQHYTGFPYYPYIDPHSHSHPPNLNPPDSSPDHAGANQIGSKRPLGYGDSNGEVAILEPSQKRTRHCCKCGSQDCKGKGGRNFCVNACQDCGKMDCRGRNSRRPDKVCSEAWN